MDTNAIVLAPVVGASVVAPPTVAPSATTLPPLVVVPAIATAPLVPVLPTYTKPFPDISTIEVFSGQNFKRWQEQIYFTLNMHGAAWLLSTKNTLPNSETWTRTRFVNIPSYDICHARLGHVSSGYIKKMQTLGLINNIDYSNLSKFQICVTSKQTKKTRGSATRETKLLELIHYDLEDLKQNMTRGGKKLYVTFVDDYSRFTRVYLLRNKDEAFDMFLSYKVEVEN